MERIPIIANAKLFDKAVGELQTSLGTSLPWLEHVFGIVEKVSRKIDNKTYKIATVFTGNENYEQVEPCNELGDFCFFVLSDPQELFARDRASISSPISAVFWYDMRKVSSEPSSRNREAVKVQILNALKDLHLPSGTFEWNRVYENPENVFSGFSYDHIDNQYLMSPYAGLRVDGVVYANVPCNN